MFVFRFISFHVQGTSIFHFSQPEYKSFAESKFIADTLMARALLCFSWLRWHGGGTGVAIGFPALLDSFMNILWFCTKRLFVAHFTMDSDFRDWNNPFFKTRAAHQPVKRAATAPQPQQESERKKTSNQCFKSFPTRKRKFNLSTLSLHDLSFYPAPAS